MRLTTPKAAFLAVALLTLPASPPAAAETRPTLPKAGPAQPKTGAAQAKPETVASVEGITE